MRKRYIYLLLSAGVLWCSPIWAQEGSDVLFGRVTCGGHGVPYATLQLQGTSVGVACNDDGEYSFKVPAGHKQDTVVVRSMGYNQTKRTVADLLKNGNVRLVRHTVDLRTVEVKSWRSADRLLRAAVARIDSNYQQRTAISTFFYRDWRAVDGELYLFDEAVMDIKRTGYSKYAKKMAYGFSSTRREMGTNYKTLLKHRLLVYDRNLLDGKVDDPAGVDEMMSYADNEEFYDPVSTPQATFSLSRHMVAQHMFESIREFDADDVAYYLLRSVGPCHVVKAKMHYEYIIRKSDLAIVSITAVMDSINIESPNDAWVNVDYNRMMMAADSSVWRYDVREGKYTLTRYYNRQTVSLGTGGPLHGNVKQRWQRCVEWTLTDFRMGGDDMHGSVIAVKPQSVEGAFGTSDFSSDFWGQYNSIPIDSQPLQLLKEKLEIIKTRHEKN